MYVLYPNTYFLKMFPHVFSFLLCSKKSDLYVYFILNRFACPLISVLFFNNHNNKICKIFENVCLGLLNYLYDMIISYFML